MNTSQFLLSAWTWSPGVLLAVAGLLACYLAAFGVNPRLRWQLAGVGILLLTLLSPLNALADGYLFSAHMLQHILLLLVAPALLLLSLPPTPSSPAKPKFFGNPLVGWPAGVGAMWFWHAPTLCNAAVSSAPIHALQTISLVVLGTLFWQPILSPRENNRLAPPGAVAYLLSACMMCSILGIIITFSPVAVCSIYTMPMADRWNMLPTIRSDWGFTPQRDQQVGGLLMWVPMCMIYLSAIFAQIIRWYAEPATTTKGAS